MTPITLNLSTATDEQINALVAEYVANLDMTRPAAPYFVPDYLHDPAAHERPQVSANATIGLAVVTVTFLGLRTWFSRGGGGRFGAKVRASDHDSWRDAVEQQEEYLRQLKAREPKP